MVSPTILTICKSKCNLQWVLTHIFLHFSCKVKSWYVVYFTLSCLLLLFHICPLVMRGTYMWYTIVWWGGHRLDHFSPTNILSVHRVQQVSPSILLHSAQVISSARCTGALHCIALNFSAGQCTVLNWIALHCNTLNFIALHCNALNCIALHCTALHCTKLY